VTLFGAESLRRTSGKSLGQFDGLAPRDRHSGGDRPRESDRFFYFFALFSAILGQVSAPLLQAEQRPGAHHRAVSSAAPDALFGSWRCLEPEMGPRQPPKKADPGLRDFTTISIKLSILSLTLVPALTEANFAIYMRATTQIN
jgi:hypothetical protein